MKHYTENTLKGLYLLTVLSLFLPWFTYNPSMMGYCCGSQFLPFFLIPVCISGLFLFRFDKSRLWGLLCLVSAIADIGILVYILGYWQKYRNIREGFQLLDGLHTARFGFWLTAFLHTAFFILVSVSIFTRKHVEEAST